jgi:hypothetical protein
MMPTSSSLPVPDLSAAGAYVSAQQPQHSALDAVAHDALIIYGLAWIWRRLTSRRVRSRPVARSATGLCRCRRH